MLRNELVLSRVRTLRWFAAHSKRQPSYGERYIAQNITEPKSTY